MSKLITPEELRKQWETICVTCDNTELIDEKFEDWIQGIQHQVIEACAGKVATAILQETHAACVPRQGVLESLADVAAEIRALKEA